MLIDLVHEFCFNARRAIERAEKYRPGIIARLQAYKAHGSTDELVLSNIDRTFHPEPIYLTNESFWWILGRIIHSKETEVIYRTVKVVFTNEATGQHYTIKQPAAFGFSSDRDGEKINHYVEFEALVIPYVGFISGWIEEAISIRNNPNRVSRPE